MRSRTLALFVIFNTVLVGLLVWVALLAAPLKRETPPWWYPVRALTLRPSGDPGDSWRQMSSARQYLSSAATNKLPIYTALLVGQKAKFQYPLTSLFPFTVLEDLAAILNINREKFFLLVGWPFILVALASTYTLLRVRLPESEAGLLLGAVVVFAGLTYHPLVKPLVTGNWQTWINGFFALALLAFAIGYRAVSGVLFGLMCLLKPHYALFLLWSLLRKEWRFAIACLVVGLTGLTASVAVWGWADNLDYLNGLSFLSQHGESSYHNQSPNGLLNRLAWLFDQQHKMHAGLPFPEYVPFVYVGTLLSALLLIFTALAFRPKDKTIDFCIMIVSITIASPITWQHHYGVLFPIYVVAFAALRESPTALMWLAASFVLTSHNIEAVGLFTRTPVNLLVSYMLFGALILLMLLYRAGFPAIAAQLARAPEGNREVQDGASGSGDTLER